MRVALVSPYDLDAPGGVQSHVAALARELARVGDEVTIVGPGRTGRTTEDGVEVVRVGRSIGVAFNGSVAPVLIDPRGVGRALAAIRARGCEVVHVHEPLVPLLGLGVALGTDRALVTTDHAWSERSRLLRLARPVGRRVLARAGAVLAVSPPAAAYHAHALGVDIARYDVVPNGVDVTRFADARRARTVVPPVRGALHVVFVGRLERRKGIVVLARAWARLRAERPDLDVRLDVVGRGGDEAEARRLLADQRDVRFLGQVGQDELAGVLAEADAAVAPSLGGESFGIVLLEAMAAGLALIASDLPGYRSVVTHDRDALVVAPGDEAALVAALALLADEPDRRARLVARAMGEVAAYDWPRIAARVRASYERALGRGATRSERP